jgi:hypothetical protein
VTTLEKMTALATHISRIEPSGLAPEIRELVTNFQILRGLADIAGIHLPGNPLELILPADPEEADQTLDKLVCLLLELRGDDLPPFDPGRYGESIVAELLHGVTADPGAPA